MLRFCAQTFKLIGLILAFAGTILIGKPPTPYFCFRWRATARLRNVVKATMEFRKQGSQRARRSEGSQVNVRSIVSRLVVTSPSVAARQDSYATGAGGDVLDQRFDEDTHVHIAAGEGDCKDVPVYQHSSGLAGSIAEERASSSKSDARSDAGLLQAV